MFNQFKEPKPMFGIGETRDMEVFFFEKYGEPSTPFRWESLDTKIESMVAHCCSTRGIQGLTTVLETQDESHTLGKGD